MKPSRRSFIKHSAFGLAASGTFPFSHCAFGDTGNNDSHVQAAKLAKSLHTSETLTIMLPQGSESNVQPVADLFTQATNIAVKIFTVPVDEINTQMFLSASTQQYLYDIALPATFGIPDLVEAGAIANLSMYRKKYEPNGFLDSSLYSLGDFYRGNFYGYQTDGDAYLMFYNQAMINEDSRKKFEDTSGYGYRAPLTWEELDKQMAFFHAPEKNQYGGALFRTPDYLAWEWWVRFHAKGMLPLDDELVPRIHEEPGVQALQELIDASRYLYPGAKSNGLFANWEAYAKGNIYANIGWGGTQKYLNKGESAVKGKMIFAPTPGGKFGDKVISFPYFNWGWNYTVASNAKNIELAYLFTLFASSPVPSTVSVRARDGFFDPFREEHYHDEAIIDTYSEPFLQAHKNSMRHCLPDFYLSGQSLYFRELKKYMFMAYEGEIQPKQALDTVSKSWQKLHRKQGMAKQKEQWLFLKKRYPQKLLNLTT